MQGVLAKELEQLGVPKEHCDAVCKPYGKDKEALREYIEDHDRQVAVRGGSKEVMLAARMRETETERGGQGTATRSQPKP